MSEQNALTTGAPAGGALVSIAAMNADIETVQLVISENLGAGGMSEFDLTRIKMPSSTTPFYTISDIDGDKAEKTFKCVILMARDARGYWKGSIDDTGGGSPPDCHSENGAPGVGDPGGDCGTCALNQYGSASKGAGKACKEVRQLFILREGSDSVLPEVFSVPPTSLKVLRKYGSMLGGRGVPFSGVITEVGIQAAKSSGGQAYCQATFKPVRKLSPEEFGKVQQFSKLYAPLVAKTVTIRAQEVQNHQGEAAFD